MHRNTKRKEARRAQRAPKVEKVLKSYVKEAENEFSTPKIDSRPPTVNTRIITQIKAEKQFKIRCQSECETKNCSIIKI